MAALIMAVKLFIADIVGTIKIPAANSWKPLDAVKALRVWTN